VVVKVPRFAFEKFPQADPTLHTQMKVVGGTMSIGRPCKESLKTPVLAGDTVAVRRHLQSGLGGDGKPYGASGRKPMATRAT
jgi:carbamoyl-phosphate synthase large subunit